MTVAFQVSLSFTISWSLLKLMSLELVIPSNHLILWHPLTSSCPQSFPASGSFPKSQLFASGGHNIRSSASALVLPVNIQGWFPLGLTVLAVWSPCSPRDCQESSQAPQLENISSLVLCLLYSPVLTSIHDYCHTTEWFSYTHIYILFLKMLFSLGLPQRSNG